MSSSVFFPLVAVDVGNSYLKLGLIPCLPERGLPLPQRTISLSPEWEESELTAFLASCDAPRGWAIASVQRTHAARLTDWLKTRQTSAVRLLSRSDFPLELDVARPDSVGVDRLANALAVNRLRPADCPAIVVDAGSAITVDAISSQGVFLGGAIMPGMRMGARALHEFTDLLPRETIDEGSSPPAAIGKSTAEAMRSGIYWGAVGGVRELIDRLASELCGPRVFLTGGAAAKFADLLRSDRLVQVEYVPHLTLGGIALAADWRTLGKSAES